MVAKAVLAVNPFGPVHEYVFPPEAVKCKSTPVQTGLSLVAVAVIVAMVTVTEAVAQHPFDTAPQTE